MKRDRRSKNPHLKQPEDVRDPPKLHVGYASENHPQHPSKRQKREQTGEFMGADSEIDYAQRKLELKENKVVKRPIPRLQVASTRKKCGSKMGPKYSPVRMQTQINKYFKWCEDHDEVPTMKGIMLYLGKITRTSWPCS